MHESGGYVVLSQGKDDVIKFKKSPKNKQSQRKQQQKKMAATVRRPLYGIKRGKRSVRLRGKLI